MKAESAKAFIGTSGYLSARADDIAAHLRNGRDVYAYFNNDAEGHAVRNALDLRRYVRRRTGDR